MTLYQSLSLLALFACALAMGALVMALVRRPALQAQPAPVNNQDTELLDFLETSGCNLFFNPGLAAWGLLDGQNRIIATAATVRVTLVRAIDKAEQRAGQAPEVGHD